MDWFCQWLRKVAVKNGVDNEKMFIVQQNRASTNIWIATSKI